MPLSPTIPEEIVVHLGAPDSDAANVIDSHTHGAILLMGAGDMEAVREALVGGLF